MLNALNTSMITQGNVNNSYIKVTLKAGPKKAFVYWTIYPTRLLKNATFSLLYQDGNRSSVSLTHSNGIEIPLTTVLYKRWIAEESCSEQPAVYRLLREARVTDVTAVGCLKWKKQQQNSISHKPSGLNYINKYLSIRPSVRPSVRPSIHPFKRKLESLNLSLDF